MPHPDLQTVGVLGAGAWGTALALAAHRAGRTVSLWAREPELRSALRDRRENTLFLPGVALPGGLEAATAQEECLAADLVLLASPAQHLRATARAAAPAIRPGQPVLLCAKGFERGTGALLTQVLREEIPHAAAAILSGPSFAADVAKGLPTAVTLAAGNPALAAALASAFASPSFRPYASSDPEGVAFGGAIKNVFAIACGIAEGKGFGASARAALITRSFAEMTRLGVALGVKGETLTGLSGLGDLALTCSSLQSRNFSFGAALGGGLGLEDATRAARGVVEGAATARPVLDRADALGIDMPIIASVTAIVEGRADVDTAISALLARPLKAEDEPG